MAHRCGSRVVRAFATAATGTLAVGVMPVQGVGASPVVAHDDYAGGFEVVASGFDNPRGLSFTDDGTLVVGEAGSAGADACFEGGPEGRLCIGFTSRISAVDVESGDHHPIVSGLVSGGDGPIATTGVDGVSTRGNSVFGIITASPQGLPPDGACGGDSTCLAALASARDQVGKLIKARRHGAWRTIADVGAFDYQYIVDNKAVLDPDNPDFRPGDANPYGVDAVKRGEYVVDGGANTLDFVSTSGKITVLAYLPNPPGPPDQRFPYDAVPTCVTALDRAVFVGDLAGRLWMWRDGELTQVDLPPGVLNHTNGCAADSDGNVYVVDMFVGFDPVFGLPGNTGSVVKIDRHGNAEVVATGLNLPGGIAVSDDGEVYVSNNAVCPADVTGLPPELCPAPGEIVRLDD